MNDAERQREIARRYYDSEDADNFYSLIWGGEDIHIGLYEACDDSIADASRRTVVRMAALLGELDADTRVIDLGAGYGGSARYLARRFGCHVTALNLSATENAKNRHRVEAEGLADQVDVIDGSFEAVPCPDASFDIAWSQEAFLHSGDRAAVIAEASRILRPGGRLLFTDPMRVEEAGIDTLQPVLDRLRLDSLASLEEYRELAVKNGLVESAFIDCTPQLVTHYRRVREELARRRDSLEGRVSDDYIESMLAGLGHWVDAGQRGQLAWGILLFLKPA